MVGPQNILGNSPTVPTGVGRDLVYEDSTHHPGLDPALTRRPATYISWGAVIAGALLALALLILSGALATAVGLSTYTREGTYTFGWAAGIWMVLTAAVVYFLAGSLAANLSSFRGCPIHGLMAWALSLPLLLLLMGSATGGFFGHVPLFSGDFVRLAGPNINVPTQTSYVGAAWAGFIALFVGLLAASFGAMANTGAYMSRHHTTPAA